MESALQQLIRLIRNALNYATKNVCVENDLHVYNRDTGEKILQTGNYETQLTVYIKRGCSHDTEIEMLLERLPRIAESIKVEWSWELRTPSELAGDRELVFNFPKGWVLSAPDSLTLALALAPYLVDASSINYAKIVPSLGRRTEEANPVKSTQLACLTYGRLNEWRDDTPKTRPVMADFLRLRNDHNETDVMIDALNSKVFEVVKEMVALSPELTNIGSEVRPFSTARTPFFRFPIAGSVDIHGTHETMVAIRALETLTCEKGFLALALRVAGFSCGAINAIMMLNKYAGVSAPIRATEKLMYHPTVWVLDYIRPILTEVLPEFIKEQHWFETHNQAMMTEIDKLYSGEKYPRSIPKAINVGLSAVGTPIAIGNFYCRDI